MDEMLDETIAKRKLIQIIFIIVLAIAFLIGLHFVLNKKQVVDSSSKGDYIIELVSIGSPSWPFGGHKGEISLTQRNNRKVICKTTIYVNNDGTPMDEYNWNVQWDDNRAVVSIRGWEEPEEKIYNLYFDGKIEQE